MIRRTFGELIHMMECRANREAFREVRVCGVSTDSRRIEPGQLFVPLVGERFDGHQFVGECLERGAAAALWQNDRPNPPADSPLIFVDDTLAALQQLASSYRRELPVRVVGVTGSNGKTTTKDMLAALLSTRFRVHKTAGNLNNHIGLPLTLLQLDDTVEVAVLEMGMSGRGEIELLSRLAEPEAAVITNIGEAHMMQLGSREEIARAKLEIVCGLQMNGLLVYHGDDPLLERIVAEQSTGFIRKLRFGLSPDNGVYATGIELDSGRGGTRFTLQPASIADCFVPLLGRHHVTNALAAMAVARDLGVSGEQLRVGLARMKATGMRMEAVRGKSGLTIFNDVYNASPTSTKAAIQMLQEIGGFDRKFIVLGDMLELGEREEAFHREIGSLLRADKIDGVFTFGRLAHWIAEAARAHYPADRVVECRSKDEIVGRLAGLAGGRDAVLVKASRGMRFEEIVDGLKEG